MKYILSINCLTCRLGLECNLCSKVLWYWGKTRRDWDLFEK